MSHESLPTRSSGPGSASPSDAGSGILAAPSWAAPGWIVPLTILVLLSDHGLRAALGRQSLFTALDT